MLWTGMRHGEATALRWTDVDLRRRVLSITNSRDEGEENEPKTYGSTRDIPLLLPRRRSYPPLRLFSCSTPAY
jgi:integrase